MIKIMQIYFIFTTVQYNIIIRECLKHFFQPAYQCEFSLWNDYRPQNEISITRKRECGTSCEHWVNWQRWMVDIMPGWHKKGIIIFIIKHTVSIHNYGYTVYQNDSLTKNKIWFFDQTFILILVIPLLKLFKDFYWKTNCISGSLTIFCF